MDKWFFCFLYDVIIRCVFMVVFKNYMILLFKECDLILLFECFWLKLFSERLICLGEVIYDYNNL